MIGKLSAISHVLQQSSAELTGSEGPVVRRAPAAKFRIDNVVPQLRDQNDASVFDFLAICTSCTTV